MNESRDSKEGKEEEAAEKDEVKEVEREVQVTERQSRREDPLC